VTELPAYITEFGSSLFDGTLADILLHDGTSGMAFTMFLGKLDASSSLSVHRDAPAPQIRDEAQGAPPIEWTNPNSDDRLGEIDYFALMLSLTTVLVSVGLVAYRRLSETRGVERVVEPSLVEPERSISDEERIIQLLEDHDGQMRQVAIVDEVEWSKAKVSRLLSKLDKDGEITKLRLGRENLICLRGCEPEASRSPFAAVQEN
jgi:hypothetical protein